MSALDRVLLAADLLEPDALAGAHAHLEKDCPWYAAVGKGEAAADPGKHCKPAKGKAVKLTPRTPEASTVPEPVGKPGGPGLWHVKGMQLPPYVQHLAHHLIGKYGESRGIAMAKGIVAKWKAGIAPGGKKGGKPRHVHPDVQAAASKAIGQWEEKRAEAHARSREHDRGHVKATVALARPAATAPGAKPVQQPGLYQRPSQTVSPSPPLPPKVALPAPAEITSLAGQVPECTDASLSSSARKHLEAAAVKLGKDDPLGALHVLRSAQSDIYAAHKADLGAGRPAAMTANVFARVVPAEMASANAAMIRSRDREATWRKLEQGVAVAIDKIRRRHFHGLYDGLVQQARFTQEDDMGDALDKVLRLAASAPAEDCRSCLEVVLASAATPGPAKPPRLSTPAGAAKAMHGSLDAHQLHVLHREHLAHLHSLHVAHLQHLQHLAGR